MSNTPLKTYAETQFGAYIGEFYLNRFEYLCDCVSSEMTSYSACLCLNGFMGEDRNNKMKAYLQIHGWDPDFIFTLYENYFNKSYVTRNPLSSDLLMLKSIHEKMKKRELNKLHDWVLDMILGGGLSDLYDKLKAECDRLMKIYEGNLLTVAHKHLGTLPMADQASKRQAYLTVVR